MELKLDFPACSRVLVLSLNCTVMELKLIFSVFYQNFRLGLNCTVMELKRAFMQVAKVEDRVLIVPLWN